MTIKKASPAHWILIRTNQGLAPNTILAYKRALEDYSVFCREQAIDILQVTREHIGLYINALSSRNIRSILISTRGISQGQGLSNATIQQRLTAVRLYYDFLIEEGVCSTNPVGRGRYSYIKFGGRGRAGLIPRYRKLPWIPNDIEWHAILKSAKEESLRNRLMLAMAYDVGLRREVMLVSY
jgi:site-specific recombinase XerD